MEELKPSEILKCMRICENALMCTTDSHECAYGDDGCIGCVERLDADIQTLIDAGDNLVIRRAAPENKPLTLEQLESTIESHPKEWLWLEDLTDSESSAYQRNDRTYRWSNITNYGKTWLAYARKPE